MSRKFALRYAVLLGAVLGHAAYGVAAITGVSSSSWDLRVPPTTPTGQDWYYGIGMLVQLDGTTAGLLADIRCNGTPYNDYEAGTDLIKFSSLTGISAAEAVQISRPTLEPDPARPTQQSLTSVYPMYGGFVPRGAAVDGGEAHPYAGTGFGMKLLGFYPANTSQPFPDPCTYRLELQQFSYDGNKFTTSQPARMTSSGLRVGSTNWNIVAPGFSPAIPDGNDLLFPVMCSNGSTAANGVARFQHGTDGWQPTSFVPVTYSGSEASLIRDVDGSLLFSNRQGESYYLWRSTTGTGWNFLFNSGTRNVPESTPVILSQAADGTPYFSGNPKVGRAREVLHITPVNQTRNGLSTALTVLDGLAEFGTAPGGQGWDVDHGYGSVVRLADGQWHSVLVHRVLTRAEHYGGEATPYTGLYIEEVFSSGAQHPTWTFVESDPPLHDMESQK